MRIWNKKSLLIAVAGISGVLFSICGGGCQQKISDRDLVYVSPSEGIKIVKGDADKLLGLIGSKSGVWVDPRPREDYLDGHIPGAISLPLKTVATYHTQLEDYDIIVVYGNVYRDPVAYSMSKRLLQLDYDDVRTLEGGLRAWKDAGHALEVGEPESDE